VLLPILLRALCASEFWTRIEKKKKKSGVFFYTYTDPWLGRVCLIMCIFFFFFSAERRGHFAPSQKAAQRQLHNHAYGAGHFFCRSDFVICVFLFHIPPIAGASGVGGGLILPGCENMSMKDLLALMDGSSTQRRSLSSTQLTGEGRYGSVREHACPFCEMASRDGRRRGLLCGAPVF
jgi:hypothetical protein